MLKLLVPSAVMLVAAALSPSVANAYCCWNKSVCIAACGSPCCEKGSWDRLTSGQRSSLSKVSDSDLRKEIDQCRDAPPFYKALQGEIDSRGKGAQPTGVKAIETTPKRQSR